MTTALPAEMASLEDRAARLREAADEFERACLAWLEVEHRRPSPDLQLLALLGTGVRLARYQAGRAEAVLAGAVMPIVMPCPHCGGRECLELVPRGRRPRVGRRRRWGCPTCRQSWTTVER